MLISHHNIMQHHYLQIAETERMGKGLFTTQMIPVNETILVIKEESFITYARLA